MVLAIRFPPQPGVAPPRRSSPQESLNSAPLGIGHGSNCPLDMRDLVPPVGDKTHEHSNPFRQ